MPADDPDLATLTGSRICHDLASPLGAALTGLDFLSDTPVPAASAEMALLRDSLEGARATLAMLRLAFGGAAGGAVPDAAALGRIVGAYLAARPRLRLDWSPGETPAAAMPGLVALAVLCAAHTLPRGGTLAVTAGPGGTIRVAAMPGAAGMLAADPDLWAGLSGHAPLPPADPRRLEFHLLAARIARGDARLAVSRDETTLAITLTPPAQD